MPREYEPLLFNRDIHPTYQHYLEWRDSLTQDPAEVCADFCRGKLERTRKQSNTRLHVIEIDREFLLFSQDYDKLTSTISLDLFHRFVAGNFGRSKGSNYALNYYDDLKVVNPYSATLIDRGDIKYYQVKYPRCAVCNNIVDTLTTGEELPCLDCLIKGKKEKYYEYYRLRKQEIRSHQKAIQAPKD